MKRKSSLINRKPLHNKDDGSWRKMVRFRGLDKDTVPECSSSVSSRKTQVPRSKSPKTAEYAFFKKLKEDSCHMIRSCPTHECKGQPDKVNSSDYSRDGTNGLENSCIDFQSSLHFKDAIPHDPVPLFSPHNSVSKKLEVSSEDSCNNGRFMNSNRNNEGRRLITPSSLQCTKDSGADMFSVKRQRLHQLVFISNIDELRSERHDLVSMLLTRLFPQMHEDRNWDILNPKEINSDTKSGSTVTSHSELYKVPMLDVAFSTSRLNIPRQTELSNYDALISSGQYKVPMLDVAFASSWLDIPREREVSDYDPHISFSHIGYGDCNRIQELGSIYEITPNIGHDMYLHRDNHCRGLEYQVNYVEEPNHPSEFFGRGESQPLLLGWDFDNIDDMREEINLPSTKELAIVPASYSPLHDEQQRLDYTSTASGLCIPSLFSHQLTNFPLQQCSPSANHISMLEVDDGNRFFLPSSEMANCLALDKYYNCGTNSEGVDIFQTSENHLWWYPNEDHRHCITQGHPPFGVDNDLQKFIIKNIFTRHQYESSSHASELSQKKFIQGMIL